MTTRSGVASMTHRMVLSIAEGIRSVDAKQLQTVELNYTTSLSSDDPRWASSSASTLNTTQHSRPVRRGTCRLQFDAPEMPVFGTENNYAFEKNYLRINPGNAKRTYAVRNTGR